MKRLFLLDAYALIYRAYYALLRTPRINSKGLNTSAIFGFVNTLEDILKREQPTHIAVVFDPSGPTFRHEAFERYKANREATPEDIRLAVPIIKRLVEAYRIPVISVDGYEADDVIGTLAGLAEKEGFEVFMMTPDKDYGQLVTEHIKIYKPGYGGSGFDILGVPEVLKRWGIDSVSQVVDILGLMGDASDNIPGCPGVGEKTAVKLLLQFGSIENMLEHTDELKGAIKAKIENNREQIVFSKFLATIKTDVPVEFREEDFVREEADRTALLEIFSDLEFRSHISRIMGRDNGVYATARAEQASLFDSVNRKTAVWSANVADVPVNMELDTIETVNHHYRCIVTEEEQMELVALLSASRMFCFDTETTALDAVMAELVGMSFAIAEHEAYYVPVPADRREAVIVLERFRPLFENADIEKTGHNLKYDMLVLSNYGIEVRGRLFDTIVAHYLLQPELHHNMDYLAESLLKYRTVHIDSLIGPRGKKQLSMRAVPVEKVSDYAAEDADVTLRLRTILEKQLVAQNLTELFYEIEMPLLRVLADMERTGVLIDDFALSQTSEILTARMQLIERHIREITGEEINLSSPKQVGELLFDTLKLSDKARKTKSKGQYVTDEETLEALRHKHPVVGEILDYRGLKKLLSTYVDALPKLINPRTGRVHTSFNQTVTATGRLSSSNPNLQNIPIRDEQGKEIRKAFIASEGCVFLSADYSQVELRIMAHLSGDKNMIEAFRSDHDIHAATAAKIFHVAIEEVTPEMRRKAKTANFGIIYGISTFGLSERLGISRTEAKDLIDGYFASFPGVRAYIDNTVERARNEGFVETLLHRRRYLSDINSRNSNVRGYAERNAVNAPIQGTAADIIKIAMVRIARRMKEENLGSQMIIQVHDELNFNVPRSEIGILSAIVREEMENAFELSVPLKVDIGTGSNWLEAH